ncbi:hypothetical protein [Gloeothece citriformis]|uniref:hypothetical protein n=1 Tax=Gloeothece citriformis TaxID=2546356 RepID=UPI0006762111|nr:hypothetical protein [Gloeothece citriformis]
MIASFSLVHLHGELVLGIRAQEQSPVARIAKGTLCPTDLRELGYDLILATSAFKGRKGIENQEIVPGSYQLTIGIGIKTYAYYGIHSLGPQVLVNFPIGVKKDILPRLKQQLQELEALAENPLALVTDYISTIQERYKYRIVDQLELEDEELSNDDLDALLELVDSQNQEIVYNLLVEDLSSHRQLLEHPKVVAALNAHLQTRYRELATGRFIKFKGALLQPHPELAENEFCDPNLPDSEEVIVTRSPLVNSNGVIVLTNRHLPDVEKIQGAAWMNAVTAADYLQGDFDGDRVAYALAKEYPNLRAEIQAKHQEDQRYADVVKQEKIPYIGTFEQIALSAKDNYIGRIANQVMKVIALEQEISALPSTEQSFYIEQMSHYFSSLWLENKDTKELVLPDNLIDKVQIIQQLTELAKIEKTLIEKLEIVKNFLHDTVDELGNELQVAVDGPKSALRPNQKILEVAKILTNYREVGWLKDYKAQETYRDNPLSSTNYSPIDFLVEPVNQVWQQQSLEPRITHQFQALFNEIPTTINAEKWAERVKDEYNRLNSYAFRLKDSYKEAPGPRLTLKSLTGRELTIIHTLESNHPRTYSLGQMTIYIRKNDHKYAPDLDYVAFAEVPGEFNQYEKPLYRRIGYLSRSSAIEHGKRIQELINKSGKGYGELGTLLVEVSPGVTPAQVQAAFRQVKAFAEQQYNQIPQDKKQIAAAALWKVTHRRKNKEKDSSGQIQEQQDQLYNKATVAFAIFPKEIKARLNQLQFKQFKLSGIQTPANEVGIPPLNKSKLIHVGFEDNPYHPYAGRRSIEVEGKILGYIPEDEPQLPIGTIARATFSADLAATLTATLADGNTLKIGVLKNYAYVKTPFEKIPASVEVTYVVPSGKERPIPSLVYQGQMLGEIRDKESAALLKQKGLATAGTSFKAILERGIYASTITVEVESSTINYSERFLTNKSLLSKLEGSPPLLQTLWAKEDYEWEISPGKFKEVSTIKIAVDHRNYESLNEFFKQRNISTSRATDHPDVGTEYGMGYVVTRMKLEDIPEKTYQGLINKYGLPLDASREGSYWERLSDIKQQIATGNITKPEKNYNWSRYPQPGQAAYEVSSQGDKRFSALVARLDDGRTIEEAYQLDVKGYRSSPSDKDWHKGKGKSPLNGKSQDELSNEYKALWEQWAKENPHLMIELANTTKGKILTDKFATSDISQARALAEILGENPQYTNIVLGNKPNDVNLLVPPSSKASVEEHRVKDRAMAQVATQFIGKSAQSKEMILSSTAKYQQCWDAFRLANTGNYTSSDVIMISGSGPWRGVTDEQIQTIFEQHYKPLLGKAIAANSQFVVGNAAGTDKLVQDYLTEKGYELRAIAFNFPNDGCALV